jgi:4-phosphopantoate---beta-alanine ligase
MIPNSHPRSKSLKERHLIVKGTQKGIVTPSGMIAQGRGEAFDYLLGEKTTANARQAEKTAVAQMLLSEKAVISVNGNAAVLCPKEIIKLANSTRAEIEVNIFYPPNSRRKKIASHLKKAGAEKILGTNPTKKINGFASNRALVDKNGIWKADFVLVLLEDGDRTEGLVKAGKKVCAIDLSPFSRTAQKASISIIDNITRAIPNMTWFAEKLKKKSRKNLQEIVKNFDNKKNLKKSTELMRKGAK